MAKAEKELQGLKEKVEELSKDMEKLTEEELKQVAGGDIKQALEGYDDDP